MKVYVTKHVTSFKGTSTGISEHEVDETAYNKALTEETYIVIPNVGIPRPEKDCFKSEKSAYLKALKMVERKKASLEKKRINLVIQEIAINEKLMSWKNSEMTEGSSHYALNSWREIL